jgi:hypothetical protein
MRLHSFWKRLGLRELSGTQEVGALASRSSRVRVRQGGIQLSDGVRNRRGFVPSGVQFSGRNTQGLSSSSSAGESKRRIFNYLVLAVGLLAIYHVPRSQWRSP